MVARESTGNNDESPAFSCSEALGALDTILWRGEADPTLRSTMVGLELLDAAPDWDRLVEAHDWATRLVPRFHQRVAESPISWAIPRWTVDDNFDLHYHVRRTRLAEPATWASLLVAAQQIAMTPFDRARPPWEVVLFEGLPGGKAAYLLKMHHATADGLGVVSLLGRLHSRQREHDPDKEQRDAPGADSPHPLGAIARQAQEDLGRIPHVVRSVSGTAVSTVTDPTGAVREALRYGASLRRMLGESAAAGSPLLAKRSLSWRFAALDVAFADLRGASKAAGGSLNDAYIAALLGGIRLYHEALGQPVEVIPMAIPVSVRKPEDPEGTNRIASARIAGPVGIADPTTRMHRIGELLGEARGEPAIEASVAMAPLVARLPGSVIARFGGGMTKSNDLQASNIPGLRHDVYLAGARIERVYAFGPLPGCAIMVTMLSHGDTCCLAVNYDAASITEPTEFVNSLAAGFAEVLALHPGSADPVIRR